MKSRVPNLENLKRDSHFFWKQSLFANKTLKGHHQMSYKSVKQIELPAKLLDYFLMTHRSNINQSIESEN